MLNICLYNKLLAYHWSRNALCELFKSEKIFIRCKNSLFEILKFKVTQTSHYQTFMQKVLASVKKNVFLCFDLCVCFVHFPRFECFLPVTVRYQWLKIYFNVSDKYDGILLPLLQSDQKYLKISNKSVELKYM